VVPAESADVFGSALRRKHVARKPYLYLMG
jgi:hypothetical protein